MQSVSTQFNNHAAGSIRKIAYKVMMSFEKDFTDTIDFFTLDTSELNGPDFLQGSGDVVQEWDKYVYIDYSDRVLSIEWEREEDIPYSVVQSIADVTFDNSDDFFTPGGGSDIDGYILPRRPIRLFAGFGNEVVPVFIGLTEGMPKIDEKAKTATFHCIDFASWIFNRKISESVIYVNQRVDVILDGLLQLVGLDPTQYELDTANNTIGVAFFEKNDTLGPIIKKLMEAELGSFLLDENGILRFRTRQNYSDTPVYTFDTDNTNGFDTRVKDDIINFVEVNAKPLEVQPNDIIYRLSSPITIAAGDTIEQFFSFDNPVTSVDTPVYIANSAEDGSGTDLTSDIDITNQDDFSKATKLTIENTGSTTAYITELTITGLAAKSTRDVFIEESSAISIEKYEEQRMEINNDYVQDPDDAQTLALVILALYGTFGSVYKADVKGNPALQTNDQVSVDLNTDADEYAISGIHSSIIKGKFSQRITLRTRPVVSYFELDTSELGGGDVLSI